jgi:ABC-2 type transport system ATP-binding protein
MNSSITLRPLANAMNHPFESTPSLGESSPKSEPLVQVFAFHKTYRDTLAVTGLTFEVGAGSVMGLVGPNGAGKTTTLRALAGIIPPTRGSLRIAGHDITAEPVAAKRQLAFVPDDPRLFDTLTVWEHLEFVASAYDVADFRPLATELLRDLELSE